MQELVVEKFGKDEWEQSLADAGLSKRMTILASSDVDDAVVMKVIEAVCRNLQVTLEQAAEAFGEYWICVYSQRLYGHYYAKHSTARSFLMDTSSVHAALTKKMKDARPPRFQYEEKDDRTLIMHYESHRGLIDFVVGLAKGVGIFYKENLKVTKQGKDRVQIVFE